MLAPNAPQPEHETNSPAPLEQDIAEPSFSGTPKPIEEFVARADFPRCARGAYIDIRGFAGIVVDIVNQSIKVRSAEGITQSFNSNRLKTLYAPPDHSEPIPMTRNRDQAEPHPGPRPIRPEPAAPPRIYITNPDFTQHLQPITDLARRPDFPQCAYGQHVDIQGNTGVVIEVVKGSLKIQSVTGSTLSYNGEVLRKLYGKA